MIDNDSAVMFKPTFQQDDPETLTSHVESLLGLDWIFLTKNDGKIIFGKFSLFKD